ncbi:melanoma-associated antigen 4-like [Erinaceus europaeus]|uniref:Melanoma-associated antigen 4-like n=1 Tax=Erinaceus europaeus TaxID=9365 RepID=A0A1S3A7C9_ERIEU|nr:melanoma-associated antigen 4-like [Erinaceus europaeus]
MSSHCDQAELRKMEEDLQGPEEAPGLAGGQQSGAREGVFSSSSSASALSPDTLLREAATGVPGALESPPRASCSPRAAADTEWRQPQEVITDSQSEEEEEDVEEEVENAHNQPEEEDPRNAEEEGAVGPRQEAAGAQFAHFQELLYTKMADLVSFLLNKYRRREISTQVEILNQVLDEEQEHFPLIFRQARECLQLVFGIDVQEVDPPGLSWVLAPTLGLTYDGLTEAEDSVPKTGLLVMVLGVIVLQGDCASEADMWESLNLMGLSAGREHYIFGEPRELLTNEWVQEQYLVYQRVRGSRPAHYEFLWGPRAHAETSRQRVLYRLFMVYSMNPGCFLALSGEEIN